MGHDIHRIVRCAPFLRIASVMHRVRDVLGLLGSRRRLLADQCRSGTKHNRSLKLAELYTAAVDAPKSGILPHLHEIPRRIFKVLRLFSPSYGRRLS